MLSKLTIRNYALIDSLDLEFGPGLTIITGETGAGKSIMLGALSLIMGGRADTRVIADGGAKSHRLRSSSGIYSLISISTGIRMR